MASKVYGAVVKPDGLKVHTLPNMGAHILDILSKGDRVEVLSNNGTWAHVRVCKNGEIGYAGAKHLEMVCEPVAPIDAPRPEPKREPRMAVPVIAWVLGAAGILALLAVWAAS